MSPKPPNLTAAVVSSCASSPSSVSFSIVSTLSNMSNATRLSSGTSSVSQSISAPSGQQRPSKAEQADLIAAVQHQQHNLQQQQHLQHFQRQQQQQQQINQEQHQHQQQYYASLRKDVRIDSRANTLVYGTAPAHSVHHQPQPQQQGQMQHPQHHQGQAQLVAYPVHVYANGHLMSASDFDQNSSSSNSSASFAVRPTPQATNLQAANKIKTKCAPNAASANSNDATLSASSANSRYLKGQAQNGSPDSSLADERCQNSNNEANSKGANKACKPKSSPRHLLYEVLLSPIKRKVKITNRYTRFTAVDWRINVVIDQCTHKCYIWQCLPSFYAVITLLQRAHAVQVSISNMWRPEAGIVSVPVSHDDYRQWSALVHHRLSFILTQ